MDEQGLEFKAIVSNGLKFGGSLGIPEHIPWLRWMFPLDEEAYAKHANRRDRLSKAIMDEHTQARNISGGTKQHFIDALLTLQDQYELSEDTIIGLLWVWTMLIHFLFSCFRVLFCGIDVKYTVSTTYSIKIRNLETDRCFSNKTHLYERCFE